MTWIWPMHGLNFVISTPSLWNTVLGVRTSNIPSASSSKKLTSQEIRLRYSSEPAICLCIPLGRKRDFRIVIPAWEGKCEKGPILGAFCLLLQTPSFGRCADAYLSLNSLLNLFKPYVLKGKDYARRLHLISHSYTDILLRNRVTKSYILSTFWAFHLMHDKIKL